MRSARPSSARRSPPGCMRTRNGRRRYAKVSLPVCRKAGSASRRIWRGRFCSSHRRRQTSTPATCFTPTAVTRRGEAMAKARIAVVGAGLMGHGIAQVFALAGHGVTIYDSIVASLDTVKTRILTNLKDLGDDQKAVERVTPVSDLAQAVRDADYVVEAVVEDLPLKQKMFAEIESYVRPDTILASNSSVIPITRIMEGLKQRERALGTHWWNPPYLVPLVEVIETQWTSRPAIDFTMKLHAAAGKKPAHVKKDVPGFIGNRLQHALWREAVALVEHGICDAETVDTVIKSAFGRRLAVLGP